MKRQAWNKAIGWAAAGVWLVASLACANTWTGDGENWNDETKWSGGVPVADQHVVIDGHVVLTNATPLLASFTINAGKTNTCFGWWSAISAEVVTVNGTLTHLPNTDTNGTNAVYPGGWEPDSRVYVVCSNLIVNTGGRIDADAKGYGSPTNTMALYGFGPGGAIKPNCGGGYGGRGGDYRSFPTGGGTNYGSVMAPLEPGSGGANTGTNSGGWGGGAVRIEAAGILTVNGTISAGGGPGLGANYRGGGSGGSIFMTCGAFAGTNGVVQAAGGDVIVGTTGCGGGGGRVALEVTNRTAQQALPLPTVSWSARAGVRSSVLWEAGYPGTLYWNAFPLELGVSPGGLTDLESGWHTNGTPVTITASATGSYAFVQWSGPGVPNGQWTNNPLTVTMDRARTIRANFASATPVTRTWQGRGEWFSATNWTPQGIPGPFDTLTIDSGTNLLTAPVTVGSLTISNALLVVSNWTTFLTAVDVNVLTGGVIALPPAFLDEGRPESYDVPMSNRVRVVCSNFTLAAGGRIDADGRGYAGIRAGYPASGPGASDRLLFNSNRSTGSSHGGVGATRSCLADNIYFAAPGPIYGTLEAPDAPGSGGSLSAGGAGGGDGGGLVRIEASGYVLINGTIGANGQNGNNLTYVYGGSGGGVSIACHTFASTNGVIGAGGGNGGTVNAAGGGGGRIAVVYHPAAQAGLPPPIIHLHARAGLSVANNAGNQHSFRQNSELGTITAVP